MGYQWATDKISQVVAHAETIENNGSHCSP